MFGKKTFLIISLFPIISLIFLNVFSNQIFSIFDYFTRDINFSNHPYIGLNITEIIEKDGFSFEIHEIPTEDGYILTYFRIPHKINSKNMNVKRRPVLIHHGFGCSAADFIMLGSEKSLAYKLVNEGYDIWLGNFRGNSYSKKHKNLDINSQEFWDFSLDEIGRFDIPAAINYILKTTKEEKLFYIGHSLGSNIFFIAMSEYPELNDKIILMIGIAPAVYFDGNEMVILKYITPHNILHKKIFAIFNLYEFLPRFLFPLSRLAGRTICSENGPEFFKRLTCHYLLVDILGTKRERIDNTTMIPFIFQTFPSSVAIKIFTQASQSYLSSEYKKYDFGEKENLEKYGQIKPPFYVLENVKSPVGIFTGEADVFFSQNDINRLANELPNVVGNFKIGSNFSHMDFLFAQDADVLLYDKIIQIIKKY